MRSITPSLAGALGALLFAAGPIAGQQEIGECPAPAGNAPDSVRAPIDSVGVPVVIVARVHADAVVFDTEPDVRVTVNGCEPGPGQLVTTTTLPDTIEPGVRYTDVEVTVEYRAVLSLECRAPEEVVARLCEELGERN